MSRIVTSDFCRGERPPSSWCSRLIVAGVCAIIGLALADLAWAAEDSLDGSYTGKRVLTKGSNQTCPTEDDVSATIHGEVLTFTNSRLHDFSIGLQPSPDGSLRQIFAGVEGSVVSIQGRVVGDTIEADVADRTCEYHWHLVRSEQK